MMLRDDQWARIEPLLQGKPGDRGRSGANNRLFMEAVLWMARTGSPWRDLPAVFGAWNSVYVRFARWLDTTVSCSGDTVGGIALGGKALGCGGEDRRTTIGNGLLPNALVSPVGNGGTFNAGSMPQIQAQLAYAKDGLKTWLGAKTQKFYSTTAAPDFTMNAFELGGSYTSGALGLLANVQTGKGLGILEDGDQGDIRSTNWLLQATYKTSEKMKLGIGYGVSRNNDDTAVLRSNANLTLGSYYALTKSITLAGEISQTRSKEVGGKDARMNGLSLGGILFF